MKIIACFGVCAVIVAEFSHPELTGGAIAIILGFAGTGLGVAYNNFKVRAAKADAEAFQITEAARKGSTLAALDDLTTEMQAMQCRLGDRDAEILRLRAELNECHAETRRNSDTVIELAMAVLHKKGFIVLPESGDNIPAVVPAPAPEQPKEQP